MSRIANRLAPANASTRPSLFRCAGRSRSRASSTPPATMSTAPAMSGALAGSLRKTSAIVTETSGAVPKIIDTREDPDSLIATVTKIWAAPGESSPASRNGHADERWRPRAGVSAVAATSATTSAVPAVAIVPSAASGSRSSAIRSATLIAPKKSADASASATAAIRPPARLRGSACRARRAG